MATQDVSAWIPEPVGSDVLNTINETSFLETQAKRIPMGSETLRVNRGGSIGVYGVPEGTAYPEDTTTYSSVILEQFKFGVIRPFTDEALKFSAANVLNMTAVEWAKEYRVAVDNAGLATTAPKNGVDVPFNSVYYTLSTANAGLGYTANANIIKTAGAVTREHLSDLLAITEESNRFSDLVLVAHPKFKSHLRNLTDANGNPVYMDGPNANVGFIFGNEVLYTRGARTSATFTANPTGNELLIAVSRDNLLFGVGSGPETQFAPSSSGVGFKSDANFLKMRSFRAFELGHPNAAAILEVTAV